MPLPKKKEADFKYRCFESALKELYAAICSNR